MLFIVVLILPLLPPPLSQAIPPPPLFHVHGSHMYVPWLLNFLYCTLHPHGYSVTIYLYFLIPSTLHPFAHIALLSGNHQNVLRICDSVLVLLVCLVLDLIVDRYVFIATLLFIVLIFFFLTFHIIMVW